MLSRLLSRLRHLVGARRSRRELDDEMAFHVEALARDLIRGGLDPAEARRQARIRFGSREHVHDRVRQERGLALIDELGRNFAFAVRRLRRSPLFSGMFVLTLALCIGLGTAVFSVADAVLWRPLPYPSPERLANAVTYDPGRGKNPQSISVNGRTWERIRDEAAPLQRAVYSGAVRGVGLSTDEAADYVQQRRVGAGYFATLGVEPLLGREFMPAEDVPDGPPVAILSHGLWTRTFDADPMVLGETIRLKGESHTVIGIMPDLGRAGLEVDVWTPLQPSASGEGSGSNYAVLVRVPEGMSFEEADARLGAIEVPRGGADRPEQRYGLVSLSAAMSAGVRLPMLIVLAAFGLMLLVGCANLAGLQLAQALARQGEAATRQALGGGAGALVRQAVAENVVLGLLGTVGGLAVAAFGLSGLEELVQSRLGVWQDVRLDLRTVGAALALTALATTLFSLAPVLQAARPAVDSGFLSGSRTVGGRGRRWRKVLLVAQVAMVTTLLFGAGLLARTYRYLQGLDPGFDPAGVLTVQLSLDDARYGEPQDLDRLFTESLQGIRAIPGVTSAAVALSLPYERPLNDGVRLPGGEEYLLANVVYVTPDFFSTLGVPLLRGRVLDERDRAGEQLALVANQAFVDRYLRDGPDLGRSLQTGFGEAADGTIVGVVGNVQQSAGWGSDEQPVWETPTLYVSAAQLRSSYLEVIHVWFAPSWIVRGSVDLAPQVAQVLQQVAPDLAVARVAPLEEVMDRAFAWERLEAAFLLAVAAFTLLLAVVGLYGIVAHEVQERRGEIGLRLALGASPRRAIITVAATGVRLTLYGIVLGGALGLWLARDLAGRLIFGLPTNDPVTLGAVVLVLGGTAVVASLVPALRIARIEPVEVLKAA